MWGYEHCLHLGLSQRRARQAAPTPTRPHTHWSAGWEGRAGPRLPKSLGGASTGEPDRTHTQQGLDTGSPGPASQHCHSQWAAGHSSRALWGQQRCWSVSHRTWTGTHNTP